MQEKLYKLMDWGFIEGVIYSEEDNPHRIMGVHRMGAYLVFQTFQPGAVSVNVLLQEEKKILPMEMAMGLEFKLGSEILRTVIVRELSEVALVAAIIAVRAALTFLIHWEIKIEKEGQ